MKKFYHLSAAAMLILAIALTGCGGGNGGYTGGGTNGIAVTFQSAIQTGGTSGSANSTGLTLTFSIDPTTLSADNITVTGATKGALSGTGTTRSLAISDITVANGATVSVSVTSPAGYSITGTPQTAVVYRLLTQYIVNYDQDPGQGAGAGSYDVTENLVYFNTTKLSSCVGGQVVGVRIYNYETRAWTFTVKVYGKGSSTAPGTNLYSQDSTLSPSAWTDITLPTPITIDSSTEIWAGYKVNVIGAWPISYDNVGYVAKVYGVDFVSNDEQPFMVSGLPGNFNIRLIILK